MIDDEFVNKCGYSYRKDLIRSLRNNLNLHPVKTDGVYTLNLGR